MSAFAVVLDLRGDALAPGVLDRVLVTMSDRGPDATGRWVGEGVAFGHHLLALTPEDVGSVQPVVVGRLVGVFDGRLDNRGALIRDLLGDQGRVGSATVTDGELAVRAFARWGEASASHLLGDFGLAVWDPDERLLYCAWDQLGVRPLYYAEHGGVLVVATDIRGVLAHPGIVKEPDERHVAETFAGFTNDTRTLYQNVLRLPAAHVLSARRRVTVARYWDVDLRAELSGSGRRADRLDEFVAIFGEAVRCRLRAESVTVALSGGLDSTLITAAVEREIRNGGAAPRSLSTTSLVFPGFDCDESEWIDAARSGSTLDDHRIPWSPVGWDDLVAESRRTQQLPAAPNAAMDMFVRAGLRRTAVLTGAGGDQWMKGSLGYFHDLRVGRKYGELLAYFMQGDGFWLVRNTLTGRLAGAWHGTSAGPVRVPELELLGARLRSLTPAPGETVLRELPAGASAEPRTRYGELHSSWLPFVFDSIDRAAGVGHLEAWHPFFDRRVVSFAFALADSHRWRGSDARHFERRALRRLGRDASARRRSKAEFTEPFVAQLVALPLEDLLRSSWVAGLGWIAPGAMDDAVGALRSGSAPSPIVILIWRALALEAWVRAIWGDGAGL